MRLLAYDSWLDEDPNMPQNPSTYDPVEHGATRSLIAGAFHLRTEGVMWTQAYTFDCTRLAIHVLTAGITTTGSRIQLGFYDPVTSILTPLIETADDSSLATAGFQNRVASTARGLASSVRLYRGVLYGAVYWWTGTTTPGLSADQGTFNETVGNQRRHGLRQGVLTDPPATAWACGRADIVPCIFPVA
jgi:hypothetical protein